MPIPLDYHIVEHLKNKYLFSEQTWRCQRGLWSIF